MNAFVPVYSPNLPAPDPCSFCSRSDSGCAALLALDGHACCSDCSGPQDHPAGTLPDTDIKETRR